MPLEHGVQAGEDGGHAVHQPRLLEGVAVAGDLLPEAAAARDTGQGGQRLERGRRGVQAERPDQLQQLRTVHGDEVRPPIVQEEIPLPPMHNFLVAEAL